eukprot:1143584-Pelagomonas_calceolata.AAC.2
MVSPLCVGQRNLNFLTFTRRERLLSSIAMVMDASPFLPPWKLAPGFRVHLARAPIQAGVNEQVTNKNPEAGGRPQSIH